MRKFQSQPGILSHNDLQWSRTIQLSNSMLHQAAPSHKWHCHGSGHNDHSWTEGER